MSAAWIDVDESTFQAEVVERSREVPVIVDFWAPWCGPCRVLGPILEELSAESGGQWILAKVNSDENAELSRAFDIRGIPTVKAFADGRVVDEFTGALPKPQIEEFLRRVVPDATERLASAALEAARREDVDGERAAWEEVLAVDPSHALALVRRARLRLGDGEIEAARRDLEAVTPDSPLREQADSLLRLASWGERTVELGGAEAVRERAAGNPDDVGARYDLGCVLAASGHMEEALTELLEVVRRDRGHDDDGARRAMLALFSFLGDEHDVTREFRGKLSALLF